MKHRPVVTRFRTRPIRNPHGHWMNRLWWPLANGLMSVVGRVPVYRYILRPHEDALSVLDGDEPVIFACCHQDIFDSFNGLPRLFQDRRFAAITSYSRDGGLAALGLRMLHYEVVRGSSSRGGGEGLLMLRSSLDSGRSVVFAADGPKAPLGDVKPGVVRLAASSGAPVLPVRSWGIARIRFHRSWPKAAVTIPFLPVVVSVGPPIRVPSATEDPRPYQIAISRSIADLAKWASAWAHGPPTAPYVPI
ncbi:MAG: DUF374 domain-containing protein [Planctomycetota bacterium]|jgi:lysophospholipid acyltransferase (LPLAT)-like uncharacterized protein